MGGTFNNKLKLDHVGASTPDRKVWLERFGVVKG
jgi:hypothetical protein